MTLNCQLSAEKLQKLLLGLPAKQQDGDICAIGFFWQLWSSVLPLLNTYQVSLTAQAAAIPVVVCGARIQWSRLVSNGFADDSPVLDCPSWPKGHTHEYTLVLYDTLPSSKYVR